MKKKFWKLLALSIAVALIIYLALFANSMLGNPTQLAACPAARPLALPPHCGKSPVRKTAMAAMDYLSYIETTQSAPGI